LDTGAVLSANGEVVARTMAQGETGQDPFSLESSDSRPTNEGVHGLTKDADGILVSVVGVDRCVGVNGRVVLRKIVLPAGGEARK